MTGNWSSEIDLETKLSQSIVLKEMLIELAEHGFIKSSSEFMYEHKRSYAQIQKIKKYLVEKEVIQVQKIGKFDRMVLTKKGKEVVKALVNFIKATQKANSK